MGTRVLFFLLSFGLSMVVAGCSVGAGASPDLGEIVDAAQAQDVTQAHDMTSEEAPDGPSDVPDVGRPRRSSIGRHARPDSIPAPGHGIGRPNFLKSRSLQAVPC